MAKKNTVEIILAAKDQASKITKQAFSSVQSSAQVALGSVRAAALAATGAIATVSGVVGKMGIDYNAMMEQSQVAWTTLLGDAKSAQDMLKQISDFTKATPFETADVDMMAKYMHNAGLEGKNLFNELLKVSDVASAFAIPAAEAKEMTRQMSQVRQAGVAYTEDLNILQDRGVPIFKAIAEQQGIMVKDVKKMASDGKLSADIYIDAFNSIAKGVEGASEDQSKTFNGMLSTLNDNIKIFTGEITKGAFERLKGFLPPIIETVERLSESFKAGGWKGVFKDFLPPDVYNFIITSINGIVDIFNQSKDEIGIVIDGFKAYFDFLKDYWTGWIDTVKQLFSGKGNIGESLGRIFETAKSIVMPLITDLVSFVKGMIGQIKQFWDENGAQIIQAIKNMWNIIASIFEVVAPVILFIIGTLWENVKGVIRGALDVIMGLIKVFAGLFTGDFSKMWEGVKQIFFGALEGIWNLINLMMVGKIIGSIKTFVTKGATQLKEFWTKAIEIFKNLDDHVWTIISGFVTKIVGKFKSLYDEGSRIFGTLKTFGANTFNALKDSVTTIAGRILSSVVEKFSSLVTRSKEKFNGIWDSAKSIFSKVKNAITDPIESAKKTVKGAINSIKGFFSNMFVKIPMPHFKAKNFSLNPKDWVKNGLPSFDVEWYDKGGIFTGPQIIGVGEKRPEFVGALDDLREIVRDVIRSENQGSKAGNTYNVTVNGNNVDMTEDRLVRTLQRVELLYGD